MLIGALPAVILGATGTLLVVPIWMKLFPRLAAADGSDGTTQSNFDPHEEAQIHFLASDS